MRERVLHLTTTTTTTTTTATALSCWHYRVGTCCFAIALEHPTPNTGYVGDVPPSFRRRRGHQRGYEDEAWMCKRAAV
jgi:hypothetical protein